MNIITLNARLASVSNMIFTGYSLTNIYVWFTGGGTMPKISLDMPQELADDLRIHVGDDKKFVSLADAVRTACRKMLDQLDSIDLRHGRRKTE